MFKILNVKNTRVSIKTNIFVDETFIYVLNEFCNCYNYKLVSINKDKSVFVIDLKERFLIPKTKKDYILFEKDLIRFFTL